MSKSFSDRVQDQLATPASLSPNPSDDDSAQIGSDQNERQILGITHAKDGLSSDHGDTHQRANTTPATSLSKPVPQALKLSTAEIVDLTTSPESVPLRRQIPGEDLYVSATSSILDSTALSERLSAVAESAESLTKNVSPLSTTPVLLHPTDKVRPGLRSRTVSSPVTPRRNTVSGRPSLLAYDGGREGRPKLAVKATGLERLTPRTASASRGQSRQSGRVSPITSIPLPPLSLPTYLHLELAAGRPSPLYIHRPASRDLIYESSAVKFERLLNFLLLPHQLEQVLLFGALACLDAWLYNFTILPLRFIKAVTLLVHWWAQNLTREAFDLVAFVRAGLAHLWKRQHAPEQSSPKLHSDSRRSSPLATRPNSSDARGSPRLTLQTSNTSADNANRTSTDPSRKSRYGHRRTKSQPSALLPNHKGDILHGLLIILSCMILLRFDASRMYHSIRGQAAIKLYVIYNVLEVGDRLFSALGQDVLECLFSAETLERNDKGRSKLLRPFCLFVLALVYNVIHATMLFYQVVTLNVAVNSYSNALLTLLMSNQFVEIRGTVFKKFEKENLFQMTCADVVERFQLWLMLLIIALRNIVELGGLGLGDMLAGAKTSAKVAAAAAANATGTPMQSTSILPQAFTLIPRLTGQVLSPFLIVLGSEMLVDWVKHAYINKFNGVKPSLYGRFLDVLAKDYYSHAFADQNLMKRLGLPVLPLSCLFIRASVQTYHMFVASHVPLPLAASTTSTAVDSIGRESSAATAAALSQIDMVIRRALGRSTFGAGTGLSSGWSSFLSVDDLIALATMLLFFLILYLFLLAFKLALGIVLLSFARSRYQGMTEREKASHDTDSRRLGGWGVVEMDAEKKRYISGENDRRNEAKSAEREARSDVKSKEKVSLDGVGRYMMVAKRIW